MLRRNQMLGTVLLLVCLSNICSSHEEQNYSFRVPKKWGTLSLTEAACCPQGVYRHNATSTHKNLPDAIGIGVQKGGSTSLSVYMARHPSYILSRPKETHFFDADREKNMKAYLRSWSNRGNATSIRYEFTPSYLWVRHDHPSLFGRRLWILHLFRSPSPLAGSRRPSQTCGSSSFSEIPRSAPSRSSTWCGRGAKDHLRCVAGHMPTF